MVYYLFRLNPESEIVNKFIAYLFSTMDKVDYVPSKRRIVCSSAKDADKDLIAFFTRNADNHIIFESHSDDIRLEYQFNTKTGSWDVHTLLPLMAPEAIMNL